jgi:hypothetical protein
VGKVVLVMVLTVSTLIVPSSICLFSGVIRYIFVLMRFINQKQYSLRKETITLVSMIFTCHDLDVSSVQVHTFFHIATHGIISTITLKRYIFFCMT